MKTVKAVYLNSMDNCVTLIGKADAGDVVSFLDGGLERAVTARTGVPAWHKMAIKPVEKGCCVYKHGAAIGVALEYIESGSHVHVHNLRSPVVCK